MAKKETAAPSGPDWRDAKGYGYTASHGASLWAWEFLRRNADYRKDWQRELSATSEEDLGQTPVDHPNFELHAHAPLEIRQKWAIEAFYNPDTARPTFLRFELGRRTTNEREGICGYIYSAKETGIYLPPEKVKVAMVFDMETAIEPQIERARELLLEHQREELQREPRVSRNHFRNFELYLRALDARAAAASLTEIGQALFRGRGFNKTDPEQAAKKLVRDTIKQGERLRNGGYREILASGGVPPRST